MISYKFCPILVAGLLFTNDGPCSASWPGSPGAPEEPGTPGTPAGPAGPREPENSEILNKILTKSDLALHAFLAFLVVPAPPHIRAFPVVPEFRVALVVRQGIARIGSDPAPDTRWWTRESLGCPLPARLLCPEVHPFRALRGAPRVLEDIAALPAHIGTFFEKNISEC